MDWFSKYWVPVLQLMLLFLALTRSTQKLTAANHSRLINSSKDAFPCSWLDGQINEVLWRSKMTSNVTERFSRDGNKGFSRKSFNIHLEFKIPVKYWQISLHSVYSQSQFQWPYPMPLSTVKYSLFYGLIRSWGTDMSELKHHCTLSRTA